MSNFKFPEFGENQVKQHIVEKSEEKAIEISDDLKGGIKEMHKKFQQDTDMEFFVCIAFQNREQKEQFIKEMKWDQFGDKYYSGIEIAKHENIEITVDESMRKQFKFKPINNIL